MLPSSGRSVEGGNAVSVCLPPARICSGYVMAKGKTCVSEQKRKMLISKLIGDLLTK